MRLVLCSGILQPRQGPVGSALPGSSRITANTLPILLSFTAHGGCSLRTTLTPALPFLPMHHIHWGNGCSENIFLYGHWSPNPPCSDSCVSFQTTQQDF